MLGIKAVIEAWSSLKSRAGKESCCCSRAKIELVIMAEDDSGQDSRAWVRCLKALERNKEIKLKYSVFIVLRSLESR